MRHRFVNTDRAKQTRSQRLVQDRCPEFLSTGKVKPQTELRTYGTIYANKENGKLESNKRMWLYEKIHISILGNRVSVTYSKEV